MSLLKYFQSTSSKLPKPVGPLSTIIPSPSIAAANKEVRKVLQPDKSGELDTVPSIAPITSRGTYQHFTAEEKARIGKRAAE